MYALKLLSLAILVSPTALLSDSLELALAEPLAGAAPGRAGGQHDFDFSFGTWRTDVEVLTRPLSGSGEWVEYTGTSVVRPLWNGRANLVELDVTGPAGSIVGLNLRLYDPRSEEWSLHYANSRTGELTPPVTGSFTDGRGTFFGEETLGDRKVLVKFEISQEAPEQWRYEQAFSADGGATWEKNWIAIDTLVSRETD